MLTTNAVNVCLWHEADQLDVALQRQQLTQNGHQPRSFNVDSLGAVSCNSQIDLRLELITGVRSLGIHCGEALSSFRVRNMNRAELKSPRISHLSWGHVEVEGHPPFKDTKVFPPARAREWDWRETGTHHVPGIQPADVQEL